MAAIFMLMDRFQ